MTMTSALHDREKSFLDPGTPVNHGSFEPIEIISPPGNPSSTRTYPAACGGMTEVKTLVGLGGLDRHGPGGSRR